MVILLGISSICVYSTLERFTLFPIMLGINITVLVGSLLFTIMFLFLLLEEEKNNNNAQVLFLFVLLFVFICGVSVAQTPSERLKADFKEFVSKTTGCTDNTPECLSTNANWVVKFNTDNNTNHRTIWDLYVNLSALKLQELLSKPQEVVYKNVVVNNTQKVDSLMAVIDTLRGIISMQDRNILAKDESIKTYIAKLKENKDLLPNDIIVVRKGISINTRNNRVIKSQFMEDNTLLFEKVKKNILLFMPDKGLDIKSIIAKATHFSTTNFKTDWKSMEKKEVESENNQNLSKK